MPKTAAQLVPLKTQLKDSLAIFRFGDTSDLLNNLVYIDQVIDNAGALAPGPASAAGLAVPVTPVPIPTGLALVVNNAPATIATGLNRYGASQGITYHVCFFDSSDRESQGYRISLMHPVGVITGSITFNITYPPGAAGVRIYKSIQSNTAYFAQLTNAQSSTSDSSSIHGFPGTVGWSGSVRNPVANPASQAPTAGPDTVTFTLSSSGGSQRSPAFGYAVSAVNSLGETPPSAEVQALLTGTPIINGAAAGRMNTVALTAVTTSGTLPAGKWYYQVTAFTESIATVHGNPFNYQSVWNQNGPGHSESLPSAEVTATLAATGQITLNWTAVANAAGYVIYRSRDLPPPVLTTTTTATTGGTLPAATAYYYYITALNAAGFPATPGETTISNELTNTTGAGATNTITINWTPVQHAYGYRVYRSLTAGGATSLVGTVTQGSTATFLDTGAAGTAVTPPTVSTASGAGTAIFLTGVNGGNVTSTIDSNGAVPATNCGFQPPKVYNGTFSGVTVAATYTASAGATGYHLFRALMSSPSSFSAGTNYGAKVVTGQATASIADDSNTGLVARVAAGGNTTGSANIQFAGRYFVNYPYQVQVTKIGFTFSPVAGKRYRIGAYNQSLNSHFFSSAYFTATSSALQYYEMAVPNSVVGEGHTVIYFVQGEDSTCTFNWAPNPKVVNGNYPWVTAAPDHGTWITSNGAVNQFGIGSSMFNQSGSAGALAVKDELLSALPCRITYRRPVSGTTSITPKGTFSGHPRGSEFSFSPNVTYAPLRAIVASWGPAFPMSPMSQTALGNRWVEVAVSTDAGATFTPLVNGARFVFPLPATQLQFRYTLPEASAKMSFDRSLMSGLPTTLNTSLGGNQTLVSDTGHTIVNFENTTPNSRFIRDGVLQVGSNNSSHIFTNMAIIDLGHDVDITATGFNTEVAQDWGIKFAANNKAYAGWIFTLGGNGTARLERQTEDNTAVTVIATAVNTVVNALNVSHTLRVIHVGTSILCLLDGRQIFDITATEYSQAQYDCHGVSGNRGFVTGFSATPITTPLSNWELEFVAAYLEI